MKRILALVLFVVMLTSTAAFAAEAYSGDSLGTTWKTLLPATENGVLKTGGGKQWGLTLTTLEGTKHAVGQVFDADKNAWASALYTYNSTFDSVHYRDYRAAYQNVEKEICWRMRLNNDYSGSVTVAGDFYP